MSEEIKNTEAVVENDKEYEDILEKFENPEKTSAPAKKKNSHIKTLIVVIAAAVALAGIGAALLFAPQDKPDTEFKGPASVKSNVNNNVHEVKVKTNSDGKIKENGSGNFVEKVPADISKIHVKNNSGEYTITSYTPKIKTKETDPKTKKAKVKTDTTIYKLVGYESFKLQDGKADEIANACSTLKFNSVSAEDASSNLKDFGLDKPRAAVTVTYNDKTKAVFKVGNDAAQNLGTYVMFGSGKSVFLCDKDTVSKFLFGVSDYINLTITDNASTDTPGDLKSLTLSGTNFDRNVTLQPNPDTKHVAAANILVSPVKTYADDTESSTVTGAIRGLMAKSVEAVKPDSSKLSKLGLSKPYAEISAKYTDKDFDLLASKPDSKGDCYIMKKGGNVVYIIASASIPWVNTSENKLISTYVFNPELSGLEQMSVKFKDKTFNFDIKTTTSKTTDDKGEESSTTNTTTSYNGKNLDEGNFETFYKNASLLTKADKKSSSASGAPALTIKYTYTSSRESDTVTFYKSGSKYIACVNSKPVGTVYSRYIEKLISQTPQAAKDKEVKTFW